jgi:hypothetical protein
MEFIRFIFSSFWIWLGFAILILIFGGTLSAVVKAINERKRRKVALYRMGNVTRMEVEKASRGDVATAATIINEKTDRTEGENT